MTTPLKVAMVCILGILVVMAAAMIADQRISGDDTRIPEEQNIDLEYNSPQRIHYRGSSLLYMLGVHETENPGCYAEYDQAWDKIIRDINGAHPDDMLEWNDAALQQKWEHSLNISYMEVSAWLKRQECW